MRVLLQEKNTYPSAFHTLDHRLHRVDFNPGLFASLKRGYRRYLLWCRIWLAISALRHTPGCFPMLPLAHAVS